MIYMATNKINGKIYIGKTIKTLDERKYAHKRLDDNIYFHNAIKKYGIDNFDWVILDECTIDENSVKEKYYIKLYNSTNRDIGYNCTSGGDGGDTFSHNPKRNEISKKHSKALKKLWKNKEYMEKLIIQRQKLKNNEIFLYKVSSNSKKMWDDKERKKKHSKAIKKSWSKNREKFMENRPSRVGENNPMAKEYIITDNHNVEHKTKNLKEFCKTKNISYDVILRFLNKGLIQLPKKRGIEKLKLFNWKITDEIIDGPSSIVFDQAENRLYIQKAILVYIIGKKGKI